MHQAKQIFHKPCSVAVKYLVPISVKEENKIDGAIGMLAPKEQLAGNSIYFFSFKI